MNTAFKLTLTEDGIAHLLFDLPDSKVNILSIPVLEELEAIIDEIAKNSKVKLLAIASAKEGIFIAGADLTSFAPFFKDPTQCKKMIETGHRVFRKIETLSFPSVALIRGVSLGGGTELALACTYRVVSDHPKTLIGLPEVTLGIIPGWGGTQRLPRLIGLIEALPMLLGGKPAKATKALKIKLADAIFADEFFDFQVESFFKECLNEKGRNKLEQKRQLSGFQHYLLETNRFGRDYIYSQAKKDVLKKTKGHYPAPLVILDLVKETYTLPIEEGLAKERAAFENNLSGAFINAQNLIHLFFVQEKLKKETGVSEGIKPHSINSAAVIGAGTMGSGIAWLFTNRDISVRMKDIDWKAIGKGYGAVSSLYSKLVKDKRLKANEASLKFHQLSGTIDYSGFKNVDLVVEAAVENIELKHQILKDLEAVVRPDTIIGSNTSSLTITQMGEGMQHPERFIGMHFFNPADRMPLVEVVASAKTSPETIATAVDICRKLGKTPIVVRDCPGFLVNRIFLTGANEIMRMYEEGAPFDRLESMMLDFGMPMSPFVLADEVGNDVGYKVSKVFENAYGPRMETPRLVALMNEKQLYGKKNGKGFYLYEGNERKINPEIDELRKSLLQENKTFSLEDMRDRVFLIMINEAARCLDEGIVENPAYLDMALIMGIGFPPFRGGLLRYADTLGIDYVVNQLRHLQELYGDRFAPSERLLEMQKKHESFFSETV